jgi:hypothetical protein
MKIGPAQRGIGITVNLAGEVIGNDERLDGDGCRSVAWADRHHYFEDISVHFLFYTLEIGNLNFFGG